MKVDLSEFLFPCFSLFFHLPRCIPAVDGRRGILITTLCKTMAWNTAKGREFTNERCVGDGFFCQHSVDSCSDTDIP